VEAAALGAASSANAAAAQSILAAALMHAPIGARYSNEHP
jgi:hypothetical protein